MFGNTWLDYVIIGIFFINIGLGLMRGLFREIISILAVIIAFVVAIKYAQPLATWLGSLQGAQDVIVVISKYLGGGTSGVVGGDVTLALSLFTFGLTFLLLFVGVFCTGEAVVNLAPIDVLAAAGVSMTLIYRLLGGAVGFIRGYAFSVVFVFMLQLSPITQNSAWTQSYYIPLIEPGVIQLANTMGRPLPG